jgi:hypothetical protein
MLPEAHQESVMKPVVTQFVIPSTGTGVSIVEGSNTFHLSGTFPTNVGASNVSFQPPATVGTMTVDSITKNTSSVIEGTATYTPSSGGSGTIGVTVTDPGDGQTSDPCTDNNLQVTFPNPP